jgi:hypothetical protein
MMKRCASASLASLTWWISIIGLSSLLVAVGGVSAAWANRSGQLVVADPVAEKLYVYRLSDLELVAEFNEIRMATHPGFLPLKGDRVLFIREEPSEHEHDDDGDENGEHGHDHGENGEDDAGGELVVLKMNLRGKPAIIGRAPVGVPASHIAVHPKMTYAVSGADDEERPISLIDLRWWSLTTYDTIAFVPVVSADPGIALGRKTIVYHRNNDAGRLEAYPVAQILRGNDKPTGEVEITSLGHGEAISHRLKLFCTATDNGIECADMVGGSLVPRGVLPYDASGRTGGRAFFVRLSNDGRFLYSYLRDSSSGESWPEWQNDVYIADLQSGEVTRVELGPGIVFRFALSDPYALFFTIHPDGDAAHLLDTNPKSPTFQQIVATIPLDPLQSPPDPAQSPFAPGQESRIAAITPDGRWGFISHGGDGVMSIIDTKEQRVVGKLEVPTPLEGGGYLVAVQKGMKLGDTIGR